MNFLAFAIQPAASAAGVISRVQLSVVGRSAFALLEPGRTKGLPTVPALGGRDRPRGALAGQRTQFRAQCRANCMAKANF